MTAQDIEPADDIYRAYGSIMHLVQTWESAVVLLWWRAGIPEGGTGEAETPASVTVVQRLERAFTRVTAGQARRALGDDMPPAIAQAVADLIPDRNRLAHRFLREQQLGPGFAPGTMQWLVEAGERFDACLRSLFEHMESFGSYDGVVRPHWPDLADKAVERLMRGEPLDFEDLLRESECPESETGPEAS
jgi:hypothetical protein